MPSELICLMVSIMFRLYTPVRTYSSPVESLVRNSLPDLSNARPAGLKQPEGHLVLSVFHISGTSALGSSDSGTGSPLAKSTLLRR